MAGHTRSTCDYRVCSGRPTRATCDVTMCRRRHSGRIVTGPSRLGALRTKQTCSGKSCGFGGRTKQTCSASGLQDVRVDRLAITLLLWDNAIVDGDRVDVFLNGNRIASNIRLRKEGTTLPLRLRRGENAIAILALNEGEPQPRRYADKSGTVTTREVVLRPNTAGLKISNVVDGPAGQGYGLREGTYGVFRVIAP